MLYPVFIFIACIPLKAGALQNQFSNVPMNGRTNIHSAKIQQINPIAERWDLWIIKIQRQREGQ